MLLVYIIIMVLLITDSTTVINGASYGLMLWYKNVIPILLPFMLISSLVVKKVSLSGNRATAILSTIFLGMFCGYPIGARVTDEYVSNNIFDKNTGSLLLPLCNNSSPMFISGYIVGCILKHHISFLKTMLIIYIPYILFSLIPALLNVHKASAGKTVHTNETKLKSKTNDSMLECVIQITYVGIYIMLCSIIMHFILKLYFIPYDLRICLSGILEITGGTDMITRNMLLKANIKTALIIALTSFGGVSSILQTNKVISNSGLSIFRYIFIKVLCGIASFLLCMLVI